MAPTKKGAEQVEQEAPASEDAPEAGTPTPSDTPDTSGGATPETLLQPAEGNERRSDLLRRLFTGGSLTDEEITELLPAFGPISTAQNMPTTDLPPAPARHADGSVDALPGQTEGATSGQTEARVFFRSEGADSLRQVLPNGEYAKFEGSVFSTTDPDVIGALRARMDAGDAHFYEEDPAVAYSCPFCRFSSPQKATVNSHIRTRHPAEAHVQL